MEKKREMVIIITKRGGTVERRTIGDDLEIEESRFVFRDLEGEMRRKGVL